MHDSKYSTNTSDCLARLDDALRSCRSTPRDGFVRVLTNFRAAQGDLSAHHARELNKRNRLFQLPIDVLHELLHHVEAARTFILLRQTSSVLRLSIDQTGLVVLNRDTVTPSCRRLGCAISFVANVGLQQTSQPYDELQRWLPSAVRITLYLPGGTTNSIPESYLWRWVRTCTALSQPAPHLRDLTLWNTSAQTCQGSASIIPTGIFANSAPSWRSATIQRISLPTQIENSSFVGIASLNYAPPRLSLLVADIAYIVTALTRLKALTLRLITIDDAGTLPSPIAHHLLALRIEGMRSGFREVYYLLYKDSTTLRRFEARHKIREWRHCLDLPPERWHELALGLDISELSITSTNPGRDPLTLRFYHRGGPENWSFIGPNAQWLTKLTLHHLLWPEREPFPEAVCLADIHIVMTKCNTKVITRFGMSAPEVQSIFLATKQTAWRVPALRRFCLSYVLSNPASGCKSMHHTYCRKGRMLVSAELLAHTILELFVFKQERLDDIQLNCIELYEPESLALSMLMVLARDVIQTSQTVDSPAAMGARSPLPPLKV